MRSHIVSAFRGVTVALIVFGYKALEEVAEVERYVGVRILLDHERARGVLNEDCQQSILETGL